MVGVADPWDAVGVPRHFGSGRRIFEEGSRCEAVFLLRAGRVKLTYLTPRGRDGLLALVAPGELIGELSALDGAPHNATATALEPVEASVIPAARFREVVEGDPGVAASLLRAVAQRLRDASRKQLEFGALGADGRLAARLVELADRFGERRADAIDVDLPISQDELAAWSGASREAVVKALRGFRDAGWIETGRKRVTILDLDALVAQAT